MRILTLAFRPDNDLTMFTMMLYYLEKEGEISVREDYFIALPAIYPFGTIRRGVTFMVWVSEPVFAVEE